MGERLRPVGTVQAFPEGVPCEVWLDGRRVLVLRTGSGWFAFSAVCPHRGAPLRNASRVGRTLVCAWHGSEFDLRDGRPLCGPTDSALPTWKVVTDGEVVFLAEGKTGAEPPVSEAPAWRVK